VRCFLWMFRMFWLRVRRGFVFLRHRGLPAREDIRKSRFHHRRWHHWALRSGRGDLLFALGHRRSRRERRFRSLRKILFQCRHSGRARAWRSLRNIFGNRLRGRQWGIDRHANQGRAIWARNSFPRVRFVALDVLCAGRTCKFQITHSYSLLVMISPQCVTYAPSKPAQVEIFGNAINKKK